MSWDIEQSLLDLVALAQSLMDEKAEQQKEIERLKTEVTSLKRELEGLGKGRH